MVKNISCSEFIDFMNKGGVVVDVRTEPEVAEGVIPNAININLNDPAFPQKIEKLDKSKKHLVYCHSGQRSYFASNIMIQAGFNDVCNLQCGIIGWEGDIVKYDK